MIDERITALVRRAISTERARRQNPPMAELRTVQTQYSARGALGHGRYPIDLDLKCAAEYDHRVRRWLAIADRIMAETETACTAESASEIRGLLAAELVRDSDEIIEMLRQVLGSQSQSARIGELERSKDLARAHVEQELEIKVLRQDRTRIPVGQQLQAPRYAAILTAWKKSVSFHENSPADESNACKEAVSAVEQLARIVVDDQSATLGGAITSLRASGRLQPPLLRCFEDLWGWASSTPGVRHGSAQTSNVDAPTAAYVLKCSEAALGLLLSIDAA